jgi:hypothetical protein
MVAPATDQIAHEFGITSPVLIAMSTSVFVIGYGEFCICIAAVESLIVFSLWSSAPRAVVRNLWEVSGRCSIALLHTSIN